VPAAEAAQYGLESERLLQSIECRPASTTLDLHPTMVQETRVLIRLVGPTVISRMQEILPDGEATLVVPPNNVAHSESAICLLPRLEKQVLDIRSRLLACGPGQIFKSALVFYTSYLLSLNTSILSWPPAEFDTIGLRPSHRHECRRRH
jgi:hypothetical protein